MILLIINIDTQHSIIPKGHENYLTFPYTQICRNLILLSYCNLQSSSPDNGNWLIYFHFFNLFIYNFQTLHLTIVITLAEAFHPFSTYYPCLPLNCGLRLCPIQRVRLHTNQWWLVDLHTTVRSSMKQYKFRLLICYCYLATSPPSV